MIIIDDKILYQTATVPSLRENYLLIVNAKTGFVNFKKVYFSIYVYMCLPHTHGNSLLPCKGISILIFVTCGASFYLWVWSVQPLIQSPYPCLRCIYMQECSVHSLIILTMCKKYNVNKNKTAYICFYYYIDKII